MPNYTREVPKEVSLPIRLPLLGLPNQRAGSADEDSRLINGYVEMGQDEVLRVVKRPGLSIALDLGASYAGLGAFSGSVGNLTVWEIPVEGGRTHSLYFEGALIGALFSAATGVAGPSYYYFEEVSTGAETTTIVINSLYAVHTYNPTDGLDLLHFRATDYPSISCATTNGSPIVTTASTALLTPYTVVTGAGIPASTQIDSIDSATQFTMNANATATAGAASLTFALGGPPSRENVFGPPTISGGLTYQTLVGGVADLNKSVYLLTYRSEVAGSDIDEPRSWNPLNSIFAYAEQDQAVCIAKQMSYLIVLKSTTTEFFRDVGLSPGSPLERLEGLRLDVGCYAGPTVSFVDGLVIWASKTRTAKRSVWQLEQARAQEIASPAIARILETYLPYVAFSFSTAGHTFYVLNAANEDGAKISLVYDLTTKYWSYWTALGETYFPFVAATTSAYGPRLQHDSNGKVYYMEPTLVADDSTAFDMDIYPPQFDANMRVSKFVARMYAIADQATGSILQVRSTEQDQADGSWSNWREFDLSKSKPDLYDCGSFTKRFYHFRHSSATRCRLMAIEMDVLPGTL
jgi:hypothetical protein